MQTEKIKELREQWLREHKNETCSHPRLDKEYYLGSKTGDYYCTNCFECHWGNNWNLKND